MIFTIVFSWQDWSKIDIADLEESNFADFFKVQESIVKFAGSDRNNKESYNYLENRHLSKERLLKCCIFINAWLKPLKTQLLNDTE